MQRPNLGRVLLSALATASACLAQAPLRVVALPALPDPLLPEHSAVARKLVADVTFAEELGAYPFDPEAFYKERRIPKEDFRVGHGMAMMAAKGIAETIGVRGWQHVRIESLGEHGYVVQLVGAEIDARWQRREWSMRAWCDAQGTLRQASFADSRLPAGEFRQLQRSGDTCSLIAISEKRTKKVADFGSVAVTVPAVVRALMPWGAEDAVELRTVDCVTGVVSVATLGRTDPACAWPRSEKSVDDLRRLLVEGGSMRFAFQKIASDSVVLGKGKLMVPALGLEIPLPGNWSPTTSIMPAFDTIWHSKNEDEIQLRVVAQPLCPRTTLAQYTAPKEVAKVYGVERTPDGKPKECKVDGYAALLEKAKLVVLPDGFVCHDLHIVVDGVGFTLQLQAPFKKAEAAASLVKNLQRSVLRR
jgi:hypothetical protein